MLEDPLAPAVAGAATLVFSETPPEVLAVTFSVGLPLAAEATM